MITLEKFDTLIPRIVDFLPTLAFQAMVNSKPTITFAELAISTGKSIVKLDPIETDIATVAIDINNKTSIRVVVGDPTVLQSPDMQVSPKDIISDLVENVVGAVPKELENDVADAVIKEVHTIEKVPKRSYETKSFESLDSVKIVQKTVGNHNKIYAKMMGLNFINPYTYARRGISQYHGIKLDSSQSKRMRSVEATTALCGIDGNKVFKHTEFDVDDITTLFKNITYKRWHQDTALLYPFPDQRYSNIYCLQREHKYMPILTDS